MALREGGMIIEAWPAALVVSAAINVSRMARRAALLAMKHAIGRARELARASSARWRRSR